MKTLTTLVLLATSAFASAQLGLKCKNTATSGSNQPDDAIEVPYNATLVPKSGLTVEAWITYDETTLGTGWRWPTVCRMNPAGGQEAFFLRVGAGQTKIPNLVWGVATSVGFRTATYRFTAGELKNWTHVAGTYDGTAIRLYVNGVQKASFVNSTFSHITDRKGVLRIGTGNISAAAGKGIEMWNGEIDEFRLWPIARTADEIKSTMNLALSSVPGFVSTWGLDLSANDSSGKNNGKAVGKPNYGANSLKLTGTKIGADPFGTPTAGCGGSPYPGVSGHVKAGNKGFAVTCLNAANGTGSVGLFWLGFGKLATSFKLNGADIWVDLARPGVLVPAIGDFNRLIRLPATIPATATKGAQVHCQFVFNQNGCNVPLYATSGLTLTVQ